LHQVGTSSLLTEYGFYVLVGIDAVNVMAAYQPAVRACGSQCSQELAPLWTCYLSLQGTWKQQFPSLYTEAEGSSETLQLTDQTTRRHIAEARGRNY